MTGMSASGNGRSGPGLVPAGKLLAYHVDLKRPMWTRGYLDETVDRLLGWGYNALVYEIEDKLRFERHPGLAHADAWSAAETADFVGACRAKGMEVIPLMQSLGHAEAVAGRPEHAHLREHADALNQYDPANPAAHALIMELFGDVLEAFGPARYFHIGGDETWRLGMSEKHRATVAEVGIGGLYLKHMLPILEFVHGRGVRPMIWADMLLQYPETLGRLPEYVVLVDWEYNRTAERTRTVRLWGDGMRTWEEIQEYLRAGDGRAKMAAEYAADEQTARDGTLRTYYHAHALHAMGREVVTASAVRSGSDTQAIPRLLHAANVAASVRTGMRYGVGELVTSWAVRHTHPEVTMPAVYAAPHALSHEGTLDEAELYAAYARDALGVDSPALCEVQQRACVGFPFSQTTTLRHAAHRMLQGNDPVALLREEIGRLGQRVEMFSVGGAPWDRSRETDTGDALADAATQTEVALEGIAEAKRLLRELRAEATRGEEVLDFWEEGVDLAGFYGRFALAGLRGEVEAKRGELLAELGRLRERTRALWERTYAPGSAALELVTRYGFHEAYLGGLDGEGAREALHQIADPVQPPFHLTTAGERPFGTFGS